MVFLISVTQFQSFRGVVSSVSPFQDTRSAEMVLLRFMLCALAASVLCDPEDGGKAPRLLLNDGNKMPVIGLGTFLGFDERGQKAPDENEVENAVSWALQAGYRMIDTAAAYRNEEHVGRGLRWAAVPRDHVYLVTKLDSRDKADVAGALRASLRRLNTSAVDLYLIHSPITYSDDGVPLAIDYLDTWKAMEETKKLGLARSIGISNFNVSQIERLLANCEIKPAVLQVEVNLNLAQEELVAYCRQKGIAVMAYTPFGALFKDSSAPAPPPRASHPALLDIARKYNKTTPQLVLRYLIQRGVAPIPKSVNKERIEQNIDVFDFQLTDEDMKTLAAFNKNFRTVLPSFWQDFPYYPFEREDVAKPEPFKKS